ncbi:hypothetical protein IWQ62_006443 [Dispira parvispora]|uniref:G-patch domain-containing protein n=1 Tax=Dispira parvispora TaxID=1520584 RepID=A0A9W8AN11_9FUNG|nr:hypothetical protein IWQ62_006443 [Dispira parvispora]
MASTKHAHVPPGEAYSSSATSLPPTAQSVAPPPYYTLPAALMTPLCSNHGQPYTPLHPQDLERPIQRPPVTLELVHALEGFYQGLPTKPNEDSQASLPPGVDPDGWEIGYLDSFYQSRAALRRKRGRRWSDSSTGTETVSSSEFDSDESTSDEIDQVEETNTEITLPGGSFGASVSTARVDRMISQENKGFQLLKKMGWAGAGHGLGKTSRGITEPIPLAPTADLLGDSKRQSTNSEMEEWEVAKTATTDLDNQVEQYRQQQSHHYRHQQTHSTGPSSGKQPWNLS